MKQILAIAFNYLYISLRTPITVIMAFVMPILFTAVLGAAFSGFGDDEGDNRTQILLVNEDGGELAQVVADTINASKIIRLYEDTSDTTLPTTRSAALDVLDDYDRLLILPVGFSEAAQTGTKISVEFHVIANDQTNMAAEQEINAAFNQVSNAFNAARLATEQANLLAPFTSPDAEAAYFQETLALAQDRLAQPNVGIVSEMAAADDVQIPEGTIQSSPGNLVMFGLITLLSTTIVLVEERNGGTLRRLVTSPLSKKTILVGKMLGPLLVGLIQMAVLILVGQFIFGVPWGRNPLALLIMVLTFDLAIVSLGMFLSTLVRTVDQAVAVMVAGSMVMASLGGAWWPIEIVPPFMKTIGHIFPSAWAMNGFIDIILRGVDVSGILLPATILLGYAVLFFTLGVWRFRYE